MGVSTAIRKKDSSADLQNKVTSQQQQRPHPQPPGQNNPHQHSNRIVEVLRPKLKERAKRGIAPQTNGVLEQSMVPEPSVLPEPEDVPIPDTDDLVIEILTD